jgi:hypothetical protein
MVTSSVRKHPLLRPRLLGSYGLFTIPCLGATLMGMGMFAIGASLCTLGAACIASLFFADLKNIRILIRASSRFHRVTAELWAGLALIVMSLGLPVVIYMYLGDPSEIAALKAQVKELSRLRWIPLTADEIVAIKNSVSGTRPIEPTMHIQYLDANAYDFAVSVKELFAEIGFNPILLLDTRLSFVGMIVFDADDRDVELVKKIKSSIEIVTKNRVKCDLRVSKDQGQTRVFIGQKAAGE